jgi:hypothetical protein
LDRRLGRYGFAPLRLWRSLRALPGYRRELRQFKAMLGDAAEWPFGTPFPCLTDKGGEAGIGNGQYFHQDLLVARRIFARNPRRHVDVGSRIDGFVAHVASFRAIDVYDLRPLSISIPNVTFFQMDLMNPPPDQVAICDSLSCLHALEHFGLGRYGDRLDPYGYKTGFANLARMLEPGGMLYFSVPIGPQRIEFNAHRMFGLRHLLDLVAQNGLTVETFSYVGDDGRLTSNVALTPALIDTTCGVWNGCGIFELRKPA